MSKTNENILQPKDFIFEKYNPTKFTGDSGALLLATSKYDKNVQYVVKHTYPECACNEFMYYQIATELGLSVPTVKLFEISDDDLKYFKSSIAVGIEYIPHSKRYLGDNNGIINHSDFFAFFALVVVLNEEDSFEIIVDADNRLYKIDNSASFGISMAHAAGAAMFNDLDKQNQDIITALLKRSAEFTEYDKYRIQHDILLEKYGEEATKHFLNLIKDFSELDETKFDDAFELISHFYNEILGDYYCYFIQNRKAECSRFLNEI